MAVRQYIGARYVPVFADPIQWDPERAYEPLTIVQHEGSSYTTRQYTPVGVQITDERFWALTGNYNAQVEAYRRAVDQYRGEVDTIRVGLTELADSTESSIAALQTTIASIYTATYQSVAAMAADPDLQAGQVCRTLGFHAAGDSGDGHYLTIPATAETVPNGMDIIQCANSVAVLIKLDKVYKPETFGAHGDGVANDTTALERVFELMAADVWRNDQEFFGRELHLYNRYLIDNITVPDFNIIKIIGHGAEILGGGLRFGTACGWRVRVEGLTFSEVRDPIIFDYKNTEYSKVEILNCVFYKCPGTALQVARRSSQTIVRGCTFRYCEKSVTVTDVDRFYFHENWIEAGSNYPWSDNHYDVEQVATNEGYADIRNNLFIPAHAQTAVNPCWVKIGRSANIAGNRFSGENPTINPILIDYDNYLNFNFNSSIYPSVRIVDNDILAGTSQILIGGHARGRITVAGNSGWVNGRQVMRLATASTASLYESMDIRYLTIDFSGNTGRTFVADNGAWQQLGAATQPTVAPELIRFVKGPQYLGNYNAPYTTSSSGGKLDIQTTYTAIPNSAAGVTMNTSWILHGQINKNPAGSGLYLEPITAIVGLHRYLESGETRIKPVVNIISPNPDNITLTAQINDADYVLNVTNLPALKISVSGTGTAQPVWQNIAALGDVLRPVAMPISN